MHTLIRSAGLLTVATLLSACRAVYAPNIASTPLLRERGEVRATLDARNLQLAIAPADHFGIMANGYHRKEDNDPKPNEDKQHGRGDFVELGAGWFTPLPRVHDWLQLEVYGGFGMGTLSHDITPPGGPKRHFQASLNRAFVMPTLGVTRKYFDVAVSARVVSVRYADLASTGYTQTMLADDGFADIDKRTWYFFEPSVTVRAGYQWVKLQLQVGKSYKLNSADLEYDSGMVTLGLNVDLFRAFE